MKKYKGYEFLNKKDVIKTEYSYLKYSMPSSKKSFPSSSASSNFNVFCTKCKWSVLLLWTPIYVRSFGFLFIFLATSFSARLTRVWMRGWNFKLFLRCRRYAFENSSCSGPKWSSGLPKRLIYGLDYDWKNFWIS